MARKVERNKKKDEPAPQGAGLDPVAEELEILYPERTVPIGKEQVTVNEIGFGDGLRLHAHVKPVVDAIEATMRERDEAPAYQDLVAVFAAHWESTLELMAAATGRDKAWLCKLRAGEGDLLLMTFWGVNAGFFIQRAMNEIVIRREQARLSAGAKSSPPSSPTATGATTLDATPPAS